MTGYRIWFVENPPNDAQYFDVDNPLEGRELLDKLSSESKAPCDVGGLEEFDGTDWVEWYDENGDDIYSAEIDLFDMGESPSA